MTAVEATVKHRDCPYFGLDYYSEEWGDWFFGRESERNRIITNLRAARLTLLHADSGVGKSSLLRAGVARRLRGEVGGTPIRRRAPRYVPVVFSSWRDEPVVQLIGAMERAVRSLGNGHADLRLPPESLDQAIEAAANSVDSKLLVLLDQFEEYFLYRSGESTPERFADELARCINSPDLPANFLIAIREDAYAGLGELFKGRIPNVYGNYLDVQYLDRDAARDAIKKPVYDVYNKQEGVHPVDIEEKLVESLLNQVPARADALKEASGSNGDRISTPYLQLVMTRLWEAEMKAGSHVLRAETLKSLGNAETIVKTHLDTSMQRLSAHQRHVCADALRFLVTPSGTKIALEAEALADFSRHRKDEVREVLDELASGDTRVLRAVAPPPGREGVTRYEIFHDVLGAPILAWRARYLQARREKRLRSGAAVLALLVIAAAAVILLTLPRAISKPPPPPGATIKTPVAGARYAQDAVVRASYTCHSAPRTRVSRCAGSIPDGSPISTGLPGQHVFRVTVSERSPGTHAPQTIAYTVPYVILPGPPAAVQTYFQDLASGRYTAAFHDMTTSYQAANPDWPADRAAADPVIRVTSIGTPIYGPLGAQVAVQFYAQDRHPSPGSDTLCRQFVGTLQLVSQAGSWRYDPAASPLSGTVVPANNCLR